MATKPKPQVGDVLYSLNVGNACNRFAPPMLTPVTVTKVGRKYFTAGEGYRAAEYSLENWRQKTNYSATSVLYPDVKTWEDQRDRNLILAFLSQQFGTWSYPKLTLETLRAIKALIDNEIGSDDLGQ
jgi:hypothetical protein